jgi:hypothetical protein
MHTGHNFQIRSSGHLWILEKAAFLLKSIPHNFSRSTTQHVGELLASIWPYLNVEHIYNIHVRRTYNTHTL